MFDDILDAVGGTPARLAGLGMALGLGVVLGRGFRPVAKGAIRGYMSLSERMREMTAEAGESLQDLYAEAKSETEDIVQAESADSKG